MSNIILNKAIDSILSKIVNKIKSIKNNYEWEKLFISTGEFLVNYENSNQFFSDLTYIFSEENMRKIAMQVKEKPGLELGNVLENELIKLMLSYGIEIDVAKEYSNSFFKIILRYLEENNPDVYEKQIISEWYITLNKKVDILLEDVENIGKKISNLKNKVHIFNISDINNNLRKETDLPKIDLSFFEIDDEDFIKNFQDKLAHSDLHIIGKSKEETIYSVLYELYKMELIRPTFVVKSLDDWKELENSMPQNAILIPWFYAENIPSIPHNTNIFIYGEDEPCYATNKLKLRKRTRKNIINALEKAGLKYSDAFNLVEKTHGLFVPLKKKIFNGAIYHKPEWSNSNNKAVIAALLCGCWTELEGDKLVLEELSDMKYDELMNELSQYKYGDDPLIIEIRGYCKSVQLASIENAWENLDNKITDDLWNLFINLFYDVLIVSEPIFEYPFEKHFEASIYTQNTEWSQTLKHAMIRSLTMRAYYRNHNEDQYIVDNVVKKILETITDVKRWGYISQYFTDLCEASPDAVLNRLEYELEKPTGMAELFGVNDGDILTSRHYYTNILRAVEQLLLQKKYVVRAVQWLWKVDSLNIKYSINNSPKSILKNVFCAWTDVSVLNDCQKIELAKWAMNSFENAWNIIYSELPDRSNCIISTLSHPQYRIVDEVPQIKYTKDVNKIYLEYISLCVNNANTNGEKWVKIIDNMVFYSGELIDKIFNTLLEDLDLMTDKDKIIIKDKLRDIVYKHRFFSEAEWALSEKNIKKFEDFISNISTYEKEYEYIYLFGHLSCFPLLNPVPFSEDEKKSARKTNKKLAEDEIKKGMDKFQKEELSLRKLFELCNEMKYTTVGINIAKYYGDKKFNCDILDLMLSMKLNNSIILDYILYFYQQENSILKIAIDKVKNNSNNKDLIVKLLYFEPISDYNAASISKESEEIKAIFWSNLYRICIKKEPDIWRWAINECRKYGSIESYLLLIYDSINILSLDDIYNEIILIEQVKIKNIITNNFNYYLTKILKSLQDAFILDEKKIIGISYVEWLFRNVLNWDDMKCVQKCMKSQPDIYGQLIYLLYKRDDGSYEYADNKSALYNIFNKAKFCPAEINGKVEYKELKKWVDNFRIILEEQNQSCLFGCMIGRLLAFSPVGNDNYFPCEAVRDLIEKIYDDSLRDEYVITIENQRGIYTPNSGKSELKLSEKYKENADAIRIRYPKTASIYDKLSDVYKNQSLWEREYAENVCC